MEPSKECECARALAAELKALSLPAEVEGGGVHWRVEVVQGGVRSATVHCFWYGFHGGLLLGMNPSNARKRLRPPSHDEGYAGAEYLVRLKEGQYQVADGRTRELEQTVTALKAWLSGRELSELKGLAPFVGEKPRAMRAVAETLPEGVRWEILPEPGHDLWIYGNGRSLQVLSSPSDEVSCAFFVGQAQLALVAAAQDIAAATRAWLLERVPVQILIARVPGVELEPHAEVLEEDPARWHWLHFMDRLAEPEDVLHGLKEFIQRLQQSAVVTRFFTFSSMQTLCFSASSHFPWVNEGLPNVTLQKELYWVGHAKLPLEQAVETVEEALRRYPIVPFFGSAPHHDLPLLAASLARQRSGLIPLLVQKGPWYRLKVHSGLGLDTKRQDRDCDVQSLGVGFREGQQTWSAIFKDSDSAARAIHRFCAEYASPDQLEKEPGLEKIWGERDWVTPGQGTWRPRQFPA
jgi:hypothetical protein